MNKEKSLYCEPSEPQAPDLNTTKRVRHWIDFPLSRDNLADKRYFETQNYFESRVSPGAEAIARISGTPGYPIGATAGLTFRLGARNGCARRNTKHFNLCKWPCEEFC